MGNAISEAVFQTVSVLMDEKLSTLPADRTVQGIVISVEDASKGEYKIKYNDGIFLAYAAKDSEKYKVNDVVYVTVPEGDFNNKKFISHLVTSDSLTTGQYSELANSVFEKSPNFSDLGYSYNNYTNDLDEDGNNDCYGLAVGYDNPLMIFTRENNTSDAKFEPYNKTYNKVRISADFLTSFIQDHTAGNYGIRVSFLTTANNTISYVLDLNNFNGDPYHLGTWSPQTVLIELPENEVTGLASITFFQEGFENDGTDSSIKNLFMKDLSLNFVEVVDLTQVSYYLNILPIDGITFTPDKTELTLEGHVWSYGEELTDFSKINYQWFQRDLAVAPGDDAYDKQAGWGWRKIEDSNDSSITISNSGVYSQNSYKLVAIYNSDSIMTDQVTLYNNTNPFNLTIEKVQEGTNIKLKISDNNYVGDWYYLSSNGSQIALSGEEKKNITNDITSYLLYSPMTFYCQVYKQENSNYIYSGELTYTMQKPESQSDLSLVFTGENIYTYDANGDITLLDTQLEHELGIELNWAKDIIGNESTIIWRDYNGNIISTEAIDYIGNYTITSVRVDTTGKKLYYKVNSKYRNTFEKNGKFTIEIQTLNGQSFSFEKEIYFTKTGDPGTNGTKYSSLISVTSNTKFVDVMNNSSRTVSLTCKVYRDNIELANNLWSVSWELINLGSNSNLQVDKSIVVFANSSNNLRYVKATIKISDSGLTTLYNFYPVDSCATSNVNFDMSGFPMYIQYAANGLNPQTIRDLPQIENTTIEAPIRTYNRITVIEGRYLIPASEFDPTYNIAYLAITHTNPSFIIFHPIPMYINTFGNEAINGWDGHQIDIDNNGQYIFAPQVGAGVKDDITNTFTGVVMGKDSSQNKIGLYGYQGGISTFGLMQDGKAYFGAAGQGRIDIDGTNATIKGGGGGNNENGMTITLAATTATNDAIRVGNGNFIVQYNGKITANSAVVRGTLSAGAGSRIGCTFNTNGTPKSDGWYIEANRISSGSGTNYVALDSGTANVDYAIWAGNSTPNQSNEKFSVKRNGEVFMRDAIIKGDLYAKTGQIGYNPSDQQGGWIINAYSIASADIKYMAPKGTNYYTGNTKIGELQQDTEVFKSQTGQNFQFTAADGITYSVNRSAVVICAADGDSSLIALNSQGKYAIQAGNVLSDGTTAFSVTKTGTMKAINATITGTITANSGKIGGTGGWTIDTDKITSGYVTLYSGTDEGYKYGTETDYYRIWAGSTKTNPSGAKFYVTNSGVMKATNADIAGKITANNGTIGGWTISSTGQLYSGSGTTYVALDSKASGTATSNYAIWAGNSTASSAPFRVTRGGAVTASNIAISGGTLNINDKFKVDSSGNVTLGGTITWGSSSKPWSSDIPTDYLTDETIAKQIAAGTYTDPSATFINGQTIEAPVIRGGSIYAANFYAVQNNITKYLKITNSGIQYWDTEKSERYFIWRLENVTASLGYDNIVLTASDRNFIMSCEGTISLDCGQEIILDPFVNTIIHKAIIDTSNYGDFDPNGSTHPAGHGTNGAIYFKI